MLENNPASQFDIVVVSREDFGDAGRRVAGSVARYRNFDLRFEVFSPPKDLKLPVRAHYSLDTYSRLWLADFFPESVERVLYLDSDLIVVGDIQELWDSDLNGKLLAAASIPGSTKCEFLSIPESYGYFNAGVILTDLRQWRETRAIDELVAFVAANPDKLVDVDQDVLNPLCQRSCRPDRIKTSGGAGRRTWLGMDRRLRTTRWRDCCRRRVAR